MEHYKSRNSDFFHFTNPHDDRSELDDDELQSYDVDDDRSCDFNFHTYRPLGTTTQSPPPDFQRSGMMNQNDALTNNEEFGTFDNEDLMFEIEHTMKNVYEKLRYTIEGIDTRITCLEDETCKLDKHVEDVKNSAERYHGTTRRKLRQMESILQEVQDGVLFLRDKHEIAETQLQLAKLQGSKINQLNAGQTNLQQPLTLPVSQSSYHMQFSTPLLQFPSNEAAVLPSVSYGPPFLLAPEITGQQYVIPPNHQSLTPHQNIADPQLLQGIVTPQNNHFLRHHLQETSSGPFYSYSSNVQHYPSQPAIWGSTQAHEMGLPHLTHVQSSRNFKSEIHAKYMPESDSLSGIHPHAEPPSSDESPYVKVLPHEPINRSHYMHIPVAKVFPHALPTASDVEDGSNSDENGNTIPGDDIVEKVTAMGFRRDHVKACVRKLTENGSSVDLNMVLDRMMNNT